VCEVKPRTLLMKELRKFGFQLGLAMSVLGFIMFLRHRPHFIWFISIASLHLILAIIYPRALTVTKAILDFIIRSIGQTVNLVSLLVAFYLIFAPIGILFRLFRKDLLHQRIDKKAVSYWIKRKQDIFSKASYERMG